MKLSILGALVGTGLFVGGFVYHDQDYRGIPNVDRGLVTTITDNGTYIGRDTDSKENGAYIIGMVGAAVLTASLKQAWNQLQVKKPTDPYGKFRMTLDFLVSSGCLISGINLHDHQWESDGYVSYRRDNGSWQTFQPAFQNNGEEHLGFALGTIGAIWFGATAKRTWDSSWNIKQAYRDFRIQLENQQSLLAR